MSKENNVIVSPTERKEPRGWTPPPEVFEMLSPAYITVDTTGCMVIGYGGNSHSNDFAPCEDIREIALKPPPNKPYYRQKSRW